MNKKLYLDSNTTSFEKKETVQKNYDIIAEDYANEFGFYTEDLDVYDELAKYLDKDSNVLDLGAGTGRTYAYFNKRRIKYVGLDFSNEMKNHAFKLHGNFPYIVDDMINVKKYFDNGSIDAVFAVYSLFHLPKEEFIKTITNVSEILKNNGLFLFSYQEGDNEEMADEPYLGEKGKGMLYMNYMKKEEINSLLEKYSFEELYRKEKIETAESAINSGENKTIFILARKK